MTKLASIRDLRNAFPRIRKAVDMDGEVILTERGEPRYRLVRYAAERVAEPPPVDYWSRLNSWQDSPITGDDSRALQDHNRGER